MKSQVEDGQLLLSQMLSASLSPPPTSPALKTKNLSAATIQEDGCLKNHKLHKWLHILVSGVGTGGL